MEFLVMGLILVFVLGLISIIGALRSTRDAAERAADAAERTAAATERLLAGHEASAGHRP
ncbi:hypothetical protein ABIQ69_08550 [Agromyces sp. G08B096]|uniref:Uncharacterized protein n=1 Tax=Agromyces sp. G08B096 TaxID=3156399 RepID=A0AAU7WD50_9MICO